MRSRRMKRKFAPPPPIPPIMSRFGFYKLFWLNDKGHKHGNDKHSKNGEIILKMESGGIYKNPLDVVGMKIHRTT